MVQAPVSSNHRRVKKLPRPISARQKFALGVRTERRAQGLSQEQLAERAGMHPAYIGGVERGERNISVDNMERIAAVLRVPLADLLR
jgi:transcriptional regulator with XRE-family HTH domain